jgi:hypothetical protein
MLNKAEITIRMPLPAEALDDPAVAALNRLKKAVKTYLAGPIGQLEGNAHSNSYALLHRAVNNERKQLPELLSLIKIACHYVLDSTSTHENTGKYGFGHANSLIEAIKMSNERKKKLTEAYSKIPENQRDLEILVQVVASLSARTAEGYALSLKAARSNVYIAAGIVELKVKKQTLCADDFYHDYKQPGLTPCELAHQAKAQAPQIPARAPQLLVVVP